jgi:predicted porin
MHNTRETMKSILLATASILAFAGAAAAEVTFGGDAKLGYNIGNGDEGRDSDDPELSEGFFWEANLGVTMSQELNNGLTAAASFTLNIADTDDGSDVDVDNDFLLSLTAETGGLFLGDTAFAAESHWDPAGPMQADDFSEQDGEVTLRGDFTFAGVEASVSGIAADDDNVSPEDDLDQLAVGAEATVGRFTMSLGYQEESEVLDDIADGVLDGPYNPFTNDDFDPSEVFGVSAGTTFGGADVEVAYATNITLNDDSLGFEVSYPFGPVTLGAAYVLENDDESDFDLGNDDLENSFRLSADYASGPLTVSAFYEFSDDGNEVDDPEVVACDPISGFCIEDFDNDGDDQDEDDDYGIEVGYDVGNGLELYAGLIDETGNYVGAEYDLGNGAQLIASYADQDEEGAREYEAGTTLLVKFEF